MIRWALVLLSALLMSGCTVMTTANEHSSETALMKGLLEKTAGESRQVILTIGNASSFSSARIYLFHRDQRGWNAFYRPVDAVVGRNGFAPPYEKREGDGKTPSGVYPLESAFGYAPAIQTNMTYRQATADDVWIDDVNAVDYNTWTKKGETRAASFEEMRRDDGLYKYGIVIGYNRNPVVKGKGSAIFFHVWKGPGEPTAGCIGMAEADIVAILNWLNPSQKPIVIMGNLETLQGMTKE